MAVAVAVDVLDQDRLVSAVSVLEDMMVSEVGLAPGS